MGTIAMDLLFPKNYYTSTRTCGLLYINKWTTSQGPVFINGQEIYEIKGKKSVNYNGEVISEQKVTGHLDLLSLGDWCL